MQEVENLCFDCAKPVATGYYLTYQGERHVVHTNCGEVGVTCLKHGGMVSNREHLGGRFNPQRAKVESLLMRAQKEAVRNPRSGIAESLWQEEVLSAGNEASTAPGRSIKSFAHVCLAALYLMGEMPKSPHNFLRDFPDSLSAGVDVPEL